VSRLWGLLGDGLRIIAGLLEHGTPEALAIAKSIVGTLTEAHAGALSADDVEAELAKFRAELAKNDAGADAALAAKFGAKSEEGPPAPPPKPEEEG
jgi:hypothetical protein